MKATYIGWTNNHLFPQISVKTDMWKRGFETEQFFAISREIAEKLTVGDIINVGIDEDGVRLLQPWEIKQLNSGSYEKRRNTPRLPIVYTTSDIIKKLDYLSGIHGSKKAAIESAICELFNKEQAK